MKKLTSIPEMSIGFISKEDGGLISKAIKWWARIEKSTARSHHTFTYLGKGKNLIAESLVSKGNCIRRLKKYLKGYKVWIYYKSCSTEQLQAKKDYLYETLGRKYDLKGALGRVIKFIFKREIQDPDKNYCNEWAAETQNAGGENLPTDVSPSVLQDWLEEHEWILVYIKS